MKNYNVSSFRNVSISSASSNGESFLHGGQKLLILLAVIGIFGAIVYYLSKLGFASQKKENFKRQINTNNGFDDDVIGEPIVIIS